MLSLIMANNDRNDEIYLYIYIQQEMLKKKTPFIIRSLVTCISDILVLSCFDSIMYILPEFGIVLTNISQNKRQYFIQGWKQRKIKLKQNE